jgi:class 3 adenylate cyclase
VSGESEERELDPRLARVIRELEATGAPVELLDAAWRLVWISDELKGLIRAESEQDLGYGEHILMRYQSPQWRSLATDETAVRAFRRNVPYMAHDTPGGIEALRRILNDEVAAAVAEVAPEPTPPWWSFEMDLVQPDMPPARVWCHSARLHDRDGECFGIVRLYSPGLRAGILALVARGDEALLERMAKAVEPAPRPAAVVFADLEASGALSRRLPSAAYFSLLRAITTAVDRVVIDGGGIVGKHAGDGMTAFFLSDDCGSDSAAARAALEAARELSETAAEAAQRLAEDGPPIEADDCLLNLGVHWGPSLYLGQIVTGGRLEVTALGDEVNECARIQQSARQGQVLASKPLIERLCDDDAAALHLDRARLIYTPVADLPEASEKAVRDAGALAVVDVRHVLHGDDEDDG